MSINLKTEADVQEFIRQFHKRGVEIREDLTAEELQLIRPPTKPSKAKKSSSNPWLFDGRLALIVGSLHPNAPAFLAGFRFAYQCDLDQLIKEAIRNGDSDFWLAVGFFTQRAKTVFSAPDTNAHLAVYAIRAKKALQSRIGENPTKGAVAQLVIAMRKTAGLGAPSLESKEEWRRIFTIARLKDLPQDRTGRVKARK